METAPRGFNPEEWAEICGEATALLQTLIRIDTSNPPGNETEAALALQQALALDEVGCELIEDGPGRANLICRLPAAEATDENPLLLTGHLDVVPADPEGWTHPPFSGALDRGLIWGRGAIDMKNMVAMSAMVVRLLRRRGRRLRRDVIFAAVADEEAGCTHGSRFLVERHPDKVRAGFALGEVGGYPLTFGRARLMPVQTAEKGLCWLRLRARGTAGHGSVPRRDNAVVRLARAIDRLGTRSLPQHTTPVVEHFLRSVAALQPMPMRLMLPRLLTPRLGDLLLERFVEDTARAAQLNALLRNTVSPTCVRAGSTVNVIPESAEADLDGRLLPGQTPDDLVRELREILGDDLRDLELEVLQHASGSVNHPPDSTLWDCIRSVIREHDRSLTVVPYMIPGFTDAKYFSRLGARCYGFTPLRLDPDRDPSFGELFHGVDERIPEDGFHWGLKVLYEVVESFCVRG